MNLELPLHLRSTALPQAFTIEPCSPGCLLAQRELAAAIPAGLGSGSAGQNALSKALFRTSSGTVIKRKSGAWRDEPGLEARILARLKGAPGVVEVKGGCACSTEMANAPGKIVEIRDSIYYRSLAARFALFAFSGAAEVERFLGQAADILAGLRERGLAHRDPSYWNFLFDGTRACLIDVDDIVERDPAHDATQAVCFAEFLLAPLMRLPFDAAALARLPAIAQERGIFPFDAHVVAALLELAHRAATSTQQHFATHQQLTHQALLNREAHRTYDRHLRDLRALAEGVEEKEAVVQALHARLTESENRQRLLEVLHEEREAAKRELQNAVAHWESQHRELTKALAEKEAALSTLHQAVDSPEMHLLLVKGLEEKEAVIQELIKALETYRSAASLVGFMTWPAQKVLRLARRLVDRGGHIVAPRLGNLNHHAPIPLQMPEPYTLRITAPPRISLVTPSYGQAAFIERTVKSVLEQSYPNLEYYVQDGASKDGTPAILERYADRLAGWESTPDSGQAQAINRAFSKTSGEIMAWLNSDDILLPGALAYVAAYFSEHPEVDVIYGHRILIDENDQQIGRWVMPSHSDEVLSWADYVPQETLFWRRRMWDKAGGRVDEEFRFAMDWDMLVRFRAAGAKFVRLPRFLGGFRIHPHQKTSAAISDVGFQEMNRIRERVLGRVPTTLEVRKAVLPYLLKHVAADLGWRVRERLGVRP